MTTTGTTITGSSLLAVEMLNENKFAFFGNIAIFAEKNIIFPNELDIFKSNFVPRVISQLSEVREVVGS